MDKKTIKEFYDWLEYHEYNAVITDFLDWISANSVLKYTGFLKRSAFDYLKISLMDLDIISEFLVDKNILESSLFKPSQYFNADKLMRASKRAGLISHVLKEKPVEEHGDAEEWMWYTMRLYSTFLDFYVLSDEESESFEEKLDFLSLPSKIITGQIVTLVLATLLFVGITGVAFFFALKFSDSLLITIGVGIFALSVLLFWITQGIRSSFLFQFKKAKKKGELMCLHAHVTAKEKVKAFSGTSLETYAINASPIHDSLGKSLIFHSLTEPELTYNKTPYEIVYLKDLDIVIDIRPVKEEL